MQKRRALIAAAVIFALLAVVGGRVYMLQKRHFELAEKHYAAGNLKLAVREYDTSMHFYVPGSPYTGRVAVRLWDMGMDFEEQGLLEQAQSAYSALRSSFYAVRSLYTPGKHWIEKCDERLAHIRASIQVRDGAIPPEQYEDMREKHLQVLRTDMAPSPLWSTIAVLAFLGFVASVAYVIFGGFGPDARLKARPARMGSVAAALCFALWVVALLLA